MVARDQAWYHGGPRIDDWENLRWDRERSQSDLNAEGPGMYWTTDLDEASGYGGVVYVATMREDFVRLPKRKPSMKALRDLYELATDENQIVFLSNWSIEHPASKAQIDHALAHYSHQDTLFDAYVTLYHDLFQYDSDGYVNAMRSLGYDGVIVEKGTTGGSRRRQHLVLWNPRVMRIEEAS